jgi:hypothetical protein
METLSVINLMPSTKEQINQFAELTINSIIAGNVDPLKIDIQLKAIEETIKKIRSDAQIKTAILKEAEKYGQKSFSFQGCKIQVTELGSKYDFSNCNDVILKRLENQSENLNVEIKNRQEYLKFCKPGSPQIDPETGEAFEVYPPVKNSTTGLKYTF